MDEKIQETIDNSSLFKHLSSQERADLVDRAHLIAHDEGEIIVEEGTPVASLFMVHEGVVRVSTQSMNREVELKKLGKGAYFGEVSLLSDKEATATVAAFEGGTQIVAIERDAVLELVKSDEQVRKMLEGVTLARAKDTISKVLS